MQSKFTRLVFVFILYNYLIINETVVLFRYAVFSLSNKLDSFIQLIGLICPIDWTNVSNFVYSSIRERTLSISMINVQRIVCYTLNIQENARVFLLEKKACLL